MIRHVANVKVGFMALACAAKMAKKCKRTGLVVAHVHLNANLDATVLMGLAFAVVRLNVNLDASVSTVLVSVNVNLSAILNANV